MSEHTPTPWFKGLKFEIGPRPSTDDQSDGMLHPVADVYGDNREADAAFIVKAVNSHDALVITLKETRDALKALRDAVKASDKMNGREYIDIGIQVHSALDIADATLDAVGSPPAVDK